MGYNKLDRYKLITNSNCKCYICDANCKDLYAFNTEASPLICEKCVNGIQTCRPSIPVNEIIDYVTHNQKNDIETLVKNYNVYLNNIKEEERKKSDEIKMKQIAGNNLSILYNIIKTEYPSLSHPLISNQYVFAENKLNISTIIIDNKDFILPVLKLFDFYSICIKNRFFEIYLNDEAKIIVLEYLLLISRTKLEQIIKDSKFFEQYHEFTIDNTVNKTLEIISYEYGELRKFKKDKTTEFNQRAIETAFNIWLKANTKVNPKQNIQFNNESYSMIMLKNFDLTHDEIIYYINNKVISLNPHSIKIMVEKQLNKQFYNNLLDIIYAEGDYLSMNSLGIILYYLDHTKFSISINRLIHLLSIPSHGIRNYGHLSPISFLYREQNITQKDILDKIFDVNLFLNNYNSNEIQIIMWTLLNNEYFIEFVKVYEVANITDNIQLKQHYKIHKSNIINNKRS